MVEKEELILGLQAVRSRLCAYNIKGRIIDSSFTCDCKYGAHLISRPHGENGSGCPEILDAIELLSKIDDFEYEKILERPLLRKKNMSEGEIASCNDNYTKIY